MTVKEFVNNFDYNQKLTKKLVKEIFNAGVDAQYEKTADVVFNLVMDNADLKIELSRVKEELEWRDEQINELKEGEL